MKIYSDVLTREDLFATIRQISGMYIDEIAPLPSTKLRKNGWIMIVGSTTRKRYRNGGTYGADRQIFAASYDDHGKWYALLYKLDPDARICFYKNADDFHQQTDRRYES